MGKAYLIASGKGGVGKTTITAALGQALAATDSVCIIDGDIGLRDMDLMLGLENNIVYDLLDVCEKECSLDLALVKHPQYENLCLLPAAQFARASELAKKNLRKVVRQLKERFDWVLIDAPAGIERGLRNLMQKDLDESILICTPDDICIRDAERVLTTFNDHHTPRPQLIVNRLVPDLVAEKEMYSAKVVSETLDIWLLGEIPNDEAVYRAMLTRHSLLSCNCEAADAIRRIARRMKGETVDLPAYGARRRSWLSRLFHPVSEVEYD